VHDGNLPWDLNDSNGFMSQSLKMTTATLSFISQGMKMTTATLSFISQSMKMMTVTLFLISTSLRWSMATVCSFLFGHELFPVEPPLEHGNVMSILSIFFYFWTGIDLNLPLDEFGAVDFDYLHNPAGKHGYILLFSLYLDYAVTTYYY